MSDLPNNPEPEPTGVGAAPHLWRTYPEAIALILRGGTARTGVKVALVVGTLLSAVNQGATIFTATDPALSAPVGRKTHYGS